MQAKAARWVVSLLLLSSSAFCAGDARTRLPRASVNDRYDRYASESTGVQGKRPLFPFLTHLRDLVVESFFGKHPSKIPDASQPSSRRRNQYKDEVVLRFDIRTAVEKAALAEAASRLILDVWAATNDFADVRLHRNEIAPLLGLLPKRLKASYSTLIPDLYIAVHQSSSTANLPQSHSPDRALLDITPHSTAGDNLFFEDYQPLPVVIRWMQLLEAMFPSYVQYIVVGKSYEGRDIPGLRVGLPQQSPSNKPRKTLIMTGGLHAREWISTSTVNYVAWSFITSFGKKPMITKLLEEYNLVFLPVINPDGVEYTWEVDRLWRKSRQQTNLRFCRGLDLDHAFGYGWDSSVLTDDPCSESYGGETPFQAVEAMELASWARNESTHNNVQFVGLLDLHSYSQQVLFPYSFSCSADPPNLENLEELAAGMSKAIRISNGQTYTVTSACEGAVNSEGSERDITLPRLESGGGSAIDWFYHEMGAHFTYQIKLRDTGAHGFLLPKEQIIPTGEEIFEAMKYLGDYLLGNNGIEHAKHPSLVDGKEEQEGYHVGQELRKRRSR